MAMKKGKKFVEVDFSGVESGGKAVPDGTYRVEVVEITEEESSEGHAYLKWKFRVVEGDSKGAILYENTSLQPQALWKLKGLLEVLGEEVPDSVMKLDLADYVDGQLTVEVVNETYEGKDRPRVGQYGAADAAPSKSSSKKKPATDEDEEEEEEDEEEEKPAKVKKKTKAAAEPEFSKGQRVKFTDDEGKTQKGKIVAVDGDSATVQVGEDEWEIEVSDLTAL